MDTNEKTHRISNARIPTLGLRHGLLALAIGTGITLDSCLPPRQYSEPKSTQGIVETRLHSEGGLSFVIVDDVLLPMETLETYILEVRSPECAGRIYGKDAYNAFTKGEHVDIRYRDILEYRGGPPKMPRHLVPVGCEILDLERSTKVNA